MVKLTKKSAPKKVKSLKSKLKTKKKVEEEPMSVDAFMDQDFGEESDGSEVPDIEDNESVSGDEFEEHQEALSKLADTDPEFYQFLQENDKKLLQFNLSDDEDAEDEDVHEAPDNLDVASDESDFEDDSPIKDHGKITLKMLKQWEKNVQTDKTNKTITALVQAFHAALLRVSSDEEQESSTYTIEGSAVFNAVIQLCVIRLGPALRQFLGLAEGSKQPPHKSKRFVKVRRLLKDYLTDLTKLLSGVTSANIQTVLLKHLHYMSPFIVSYPNTTKAILKRLIAIWGTADEAVRVISFFCILRITNSQKGKFLETVLKSMYMTYVKNSKFMSVGTLAVVNFMRRSLVEMFALDANIAYQHVFLYIRQLAIHLRNAITANKKENTQAVYNWQYINSLRLWGSLLAVTCNKQQMQQLIYPFVQISLGVVRLVPTTQYYPLRFHVIQVLVDLSRETNTYIPVLPLILEILTGYDFNKKHQKVSMKPLHFTCLLRVSKSQMGENGFKDTIIESIYGLILEYLTDNSNRLAFNDLSLMSTVQMRQFLKKCSNVNYTRKMKQLLEKIEQNDQFIEKERSKITLNITDFKQIEGWESQLKNKGSPMAIFYENWKKLHTLKKNKQVTDNERLGDYNLPTLKKTVKRKQDEGPVELFPSDSEDSDLEVEKKTKRGKRGGQKKAKKILDESGPVDAGDAQDMVEDLNVSDW